MEIEGLTCCQSLTIIIPVTVFIFIIYVISKAFSSQKKQRIKNFNKRNLQDYNQSDFEHEIYYCEGCGDILPNNSSFLGYRKCKYCGKRNKIKNNYYR